MIHSEQPAGLIKVLTNVEAPYGDRSDAAIGLRYYDEPPAEAALRDVLKETSDLDLADWCAESLAIIWERTGRHGEPYIRQLDDRKRVLVKRYVK